MLEGTPDLLLADLEREWLQQLQEMLRGDATPVLYSSRGELVLLVAATPAFLASARAG